MTDQGFRWTVCRGLFPHRWAFAAAALGVASCLTGCGIGAERAPLSSVPPAPAAVAPFDPIEMPAPTANTVSDTAKATATALADTVPDSSEPSASSPITGATGPTAPAQATPPRRYTVRKGDHLWDIAMTVYGDGQRWVDIRDANPDVDPKKMRVGQVLVLPE